MKLDVKSIAIILVSAKLVSPLVSLSGVARHSFREVKLYNI